MIGELLGGIGCFLLGMSLMADGLTSVGGTTLRRALRRFTRNTWSGVATGALATIAVQSSTATTLMVIGFVRAGLLEFEHALGLIFGANIGTTATGWIVASLGLKVDVGLVALPLVGVGALGRFVTRGRVATVAQAVAGFGLLFVGIDLMKEAMPAGVDGIAQNIDVGGHFVTRAVLVVVGVVMTVIMQSSAAAMAATLAAVSAGALSVADGAALVIGQNVGTTATAILGATGGSIPARRVAAAHVAFNVGTGLVAFALLPVFVDAIDHTVGRDPAMELAAFHTVFNIVGVLMFAPMAGPLSRALVGVFPDRAASLTRRLQVRGPRQGAIDVVAARRTATEIAGVLAGLAERALTGHEAPPTVLFAREEVGAALGATQEYLAAVRSDPATADTYARHVATLDGIDHLARLNDALGEPEHAALVRTDAIWDAIRRDVADLLHEARTWANSDHELPAPHFHEMSARVAALRRHARSEMIASAARGEVTPERAEQAMEAARWIDRVVYHAWRAFHHLVEAREGSLRTRDPEIA